MPCGWMDDRKHWSEHLFTPPPNPQPPPTPLSSSFFLSLAAVWSRELAFQSRKGEGSVSLSVAENFTRSCQPVIQRLGVEHYRSSTPLNLTLVLALSQTHTHTSTHFLTGTRNITALYTESTLQRFVRVDFSSACHGVRPFSV